jgi:hypothetical protein
LKINFQKGETTMSIKQFLNQAFYLNQLIETNKEKVRELKELAASIGSPDLSRERVQSSGHSDKVGDTVVKIVDLEAVIQSDIDRYIRVHSEIYALINAIEDNRLKLILQKRYLMFEKWDVIAAEIGLEDVRWIFRLHNRALKEVTKKKSTDH